MAARYPLPTLWMLTDDRQGDALWMALRTLPSGSAIIVRHYGLDPRARRALFERIRRIARARRIFLFLAGSARTARAWRADGVYGPGKQAGARELLHAAPVHNLVEIRRAEQSRADVVLLSPLFPTRSHPGARTLGSVRFATLARATPLPVIALGGVRRQDRLRVKRIGAAGWAGIDALATARSPIRT